MSTLETSRLTAVQQRVYCFAQGVAADLKDRNHVTFGKKDDKDTGPLLLTGVPVFKAGTFRDSMGEQATWSEEDLAMMVANYAKLRDDFLFEDVPVRDGHPSFFMGLAPGSGDVVGYHTDLRVEQLEARDGNTYAYLVADYEITEPHAAGKIERRTWRNRSSEIGTYRTNAEVEYAPVYMGVAYVDIPAVEGLQVNGHSAFSRDSGNRLFTMAGRDFSVSDPGKSNPTGQPPTPAPAPAPTPPAPAPAPAPVPPSPSPAPVEPQPAPIQHNAPGQPFTFSVNGQQTQDFAAVQRHITALEGTIEETTKANRKAFVAKLASDNKILSNEDTLKDTEEFALSLTPELFASWSKTYDAQPGNPALQSHGIQGSPNPNTGTPRDDRIEVLKEQVAQHSRTGMPMEKIKELDSYKELQKLTAQ